MSYISILLLPAIVIFFAWIWFEIHRAPIEHDDMTQEDDKAANDCIQAANNLPKKL